MQFDKFYSFLKNEKRYSKHTLIAYETDLRQFGTYLQHNYQIRDIDEVRSAVVRSWVVQLMEKGLDSRSVNRKISSLKAYFRFLLKSGTLSENPMSKITSPKVAKKLPTFIPEKDMNRLFDGIHFDEGFEGVRDQLILDLFYTTGIRRDELINLKMQDVDMAGQTIIVTGKRNKQRIIPVHQRVIAAVQSYITLRTELNSTELKLFLTTKGKPLYPKLIYNLVHHYLSLATTVKKKSPHVLRHTFATHMLNNGADLNAIKELLGHANLSATQVYTHNSIEKLKHIYKQAHPKA
jgi:integrase/recombinase XerC